MNKGKDDDMTVTIDQITLESGGHSSPDEGMCLLEATAYLAGEPFSDHPACTSRVLGAFGRGLNDVLPDDRRQLLVPLIPRLIGTAGDGKDERRSFMALDWLIRVYLPSFLDLVPALADHAHAVRGLPVIDSLSVARVAGPVVREASKASAAAGAAVWAAAWDAAWDAARAAAGDAEWDAARDAAWAAARAAARAAAGDAAWEAAWDAARAAAGAAAWDAAWDAARAAARDAEWDAARDAARVAAGAAARDAARAAALDVLQPTVDALQMSAIDLLSEMTTATRKEVAR